MAKADQHEGRNYYFHIHCGEGYPSWDSNSNGIVCDDKECLNMKPKAECEARCEREHAENADKRCFCGPVNNWHHPTKNGDDFKRHAACARNSDTNPFGMQQAAYGELCERAKGLYSEQTPIQMLDEKSPADDSDVKPLHYANA